MKKLFLYALLGVSCSVFSQSNYFSISVGYGLGIPGNQDFERDMDTNYEGTVRAKSISLGGGINANISYGIALSENLHLDLGLGYQNNLGSTIESTGYDMVYDGGSNYSWQKYTSTDTYSSWSLRFTPSLRFQGDCEKFVPFAKIGPQLIMASMTNKYEEKGEYSFMAEEKYGMSLSVGAAAALGVEIEVADNLMIFASVNANLGFYSPTSSKLVAYKVDGVDMLDQLEVADKETVYEKETDTEDWSNSDPDEPSTALRMRADYSSVGLNFGVRLIL